MGLSYYDENIPCLAACPVHTNAGAYVAAIADGDDRSAYLTARLPNPFASVCGRVCAAPCEDACRRGEIDSPIAIRALKRFVTEKYGPQAGNGRAWLDVAAPPTEDLSSSYRAIRSETLLIWGENDSETPIDLAERMSRLVQGSRLMVIRGAGHFVFADKFQQVRLATRRFLTRGMAGPGAVE